MMSTVIVILDIRYLVHIVITLMYVELFLSLYSGAQCNQETKYHIISIPISQPIFIHMDKIACLALKFDI